MHCCGLVRLRARFMKKVFNSICQTTSGLFKQAWGFPHYVAVSLKQRRRQFALDILEVERLDRIRNPSKYLGK
jgi:hypothetical protein